MIDLSLTLDQRGRASVDFIGFLGRANAALRKDLPSLLDRAGFGEDMMPDDLDARHAGVVDAIGNDVRFQTQQLLGEYHARNHGPIATEAFEAIIDRVPLHTEGPAMLRLDPDLEAPDYWNGVDFHRTSGGWDGHPYAGYIHAEIVHRKMVEKIFPGGIFAMRRTAAESAPRDDYAAIVDLGCSTGHFTVALADAYPRARITGVDLSPRALEHAARVANARGAAWELWQRPAEATGLASDSFDLATSYILLHELPVEVVYAVFAEAFRLLRPGGDLMMADVTRFAEMGRYAVWQQDMLARVGGEPWWRGSASLDLTEVARAAGFADVRAQGVFPHIVSGTKPA